MRKIMNKKALGVIALALVCVMTGTMLGSAHPAASAETEKVVLTSPFTEAIANVRDSVVGVYNYQLVSTYPNGYGSYGYGSNPWSDFFGDFYGYGYGYGNGGYGNGGYGNGNGNNRQESEVKYASGSGVVIAKDYVVTNYHVVDGANSLKISIGGDDSNLYDATVAAYDQDKDVAVLHVPGLPLDPVEMGDSDQLVVGDWAICIGNAIGFSGTVTAGIISALDREIEGETVKTDRFGRRTSVVNTMIQVDAAINSGNSGGGMFNTAGQLVGIPTLKYSGTRYNSNAAIESIGMCIPINEAKDVIEKALNGEKPEVAQSVSQGESTAENKEGNNDLKGKPRMGVTVSTVRDTQGALPKGVYVIEVEKDSPAEAAGLKAGDIMVELNGQVITSVTEEVEILSKLKEGDEVAVKAFRPNTVKENGSVSSDGEYVDLTVKLAIVDALAQ